MMDNQNLIACICEGIAERYIINKLLDEDLLIFKRSELLDHEIIKDRSPRDFEKKYLNKSFSQKITVYRILDSRTEGFNVKSIYKNKISVINVVTAPEIEMLIILNEGKFDDYQKYKSKIKPNLYCKCNLKIHYEKTEAYISNYFDNTQTLITAIKDYRRLCCVKKKERCLADLLK